MVIKTAREVIFIKRNNENKLGIKKNWTFI